MRRLLVVGLALFASGCIFNPWLRPPPAEWCYSGPLDAEGGAEVFERYEKRKNGWHLAEAFLDFEPDGRFDIAIAFLGAQFGRQIDVIMPVSAARSAAIREGLPQRPEGVAASALLRQAVEIAKKREAGLEAIRGMCDGTRDDRWRAALALYLRGGSYEAQLSSLLLISDEPAREALALAGQGEAGVRALARTITHPWPGANWPAMYLAALGKHAAAAVPIIQDHLRKDGPHLAACLRVLLAIAADDTTAVSPCLADLQRLADHRSRDVSFLAGHLVEKIRKER